MQNCEFCNAGVEPLDGAIVPGLAMCHGIGRGYVPTMCPHWDVMQARALSSLAQENAAKGQPPPPLSERDAVQRWFAVMQSPAKNWRLCNTCFSTLGPYLPERPNVPADNSLDSLHYVLPVNCPPMAIIAGYFGLFSVLFFPAPIALILGILALRSTKKGGYKHACLSR